MPSLARIALGTAFAVGCAPTQAQEGLLDPGFGGSGNGKRRIAFNRGTTDATRRDFPSGIAVAPDLRIVLVGTVTAGDGSTGFGVARLTPNGGPDITFNFGGTPGRNFRALIDDVEVGGVAVMTDSRVLIAGGSSNLGIVLRYKADGTVDDIPGGFANTIAFQPSGRATRFVDVAALPDGRILAAGSISPTPVDADRDFVVARFLPSGAVDASFGNGGFATAAFDLDFAKEDSAVAMALSPSGTIIVAGTISQNGNNIGVAAFTPGGQPDTSFLGVIGTPGRTVFEYGGGANDRAADVAVDSLGRIVVVATTDAPGMDAIGVARLQQNGLPDATFGPLGRRTFGLFIDPVRAGTVTTDSQNRIYAIGAADTQAPGEQPRQVFGRRLLENGGFDGTFGTFGTTYYGHEFDASGRDDIGVAIALQGDRPVIVAAAQATGVDFDFGVARLTSATLFLDGFE